MQNSGHIEKLMGRENYSSWKFAMQAYLECDDLWGCITGEAAYIADQKKINKAKAKIILSTDKQNYSHAEDTATPREAWEKLKSVFEDGGLTRKVGLLRTLTSTKLADCRSVEEYVDRITNTAHKLKEADLEVKDEMVGALLLSGLPEEYKPMIMALESSGTSITMDAMKIKLLQDIKGDKGLSTQNSETAFYSKTNEGGTKEKSKEKKCYNCGRLGHFAAKCRDRVKRRRGGGRGASHGVFTTTLESCELNSDTWYLDSCASAHMTGRADWLKNPKKYKAGVKTAGRGKLTATSIGSVEIKTVVHGISYNVTIEEVLYVPGLDANLLSVNKIIEKGNRVEFIRTGCRIWNQRKEIMAVASSKGGIYRMEARRETAYATTASISTKDLWHRRLAHLGRQGMRMLANGLVDGIQNFQVSDNKCSICVQGKQSRHPFRNSGKRAMNILDLIHSDLCGSMSKQSMGGALYFVTFIDDHSRKKFVYFIKYKSEIVEVFQKFKALVENQTGKKIKPIRTDNGKEYVSQEFKRVLQEAGIRHQTSVPYSPQQNGLAERANQSIVERARCLLLDAGLPKGYWAEATSTAVYFNKQKSSESYRKDTRRMLVRKKTELKLLAHIPQVRRDKWDAKAEKMIFLGYDEDTRGYRLINLHTRKIKISRDVVFYEEEEGEITAETNKTKDEDMESGKGNFQATYSTEENEENENAESLPSDLSDSSDEEYVEAHVGPDEAGEPDEETTNEQTGDTQTGNELTLRRSERK